MILRGKEIEHHNIVTDMMLKKEVTYRPVAPNGHPKDSNVNIYDLKTFFLNADYVLVLIMTWRSSFVQMVADVTIGFVKDAKHHIDVQGFNVYHQNRLIKVLFVFSSSAAIIIIAFPLLWYVFDVSMVNDAGRTHTLLVISIL